MEIEGRTVWQQAAGDTNRDYADLCLKWGVILYGPGAEGPWPQCDAPLAEQGWSSRKRSIIRRFAEEMQEGDLVVLRTGTSTVHGVGEIVGPYEWNEEFADIDGWDLQHVRRVRWLWRADGAPPPFAAYAMKLGDSTQRLSEGPVLTWLSQLDLPEATWTVPLPTLPVDQLEPDADYDIDAISEFLFDQGVASSSIAKLVHEIDELTRIAKWYRRMNEPVSEHETVAYLVVPLLRALGWTPQRMAVEWNRIDVALFEQLPRQDQALSMAVEAKKMGTSCMTAISQAQAYAQPRPSCRRLVVTDGMRYGVYTKSGSDDFKPHSYLNLARLRRECPIYECRGAQHALLAMAPEWKPGGGSGQSGE